MIKHGGGYEELKMDFCLKGTKPTGQI